MRLLVLAALLGAAIVMMEGFDERREDSDTAGRWAVQDLSPEERDAIRGGVSPVLRGVRGLGAGIEGGLDDELRRENLRPVTPGVVPEPTDAATESVVGPTPGQEPAIPPPAAPATPEPIAIPEWLAGSVAEQFFEGYRAAGGYYDEGFIHRVIRCESNWNPGAGGGPHYGLAQFTWDTWQKAGGGDWTSPYQQGANMARWIAAVEADGMSPGSNWGWPNCWAVAAGG